MSAHDRLTANDFAPPSVLAMWRGRSLIVGAIFAVATIIGFFIEPRQAMHSYLVAFMLVLGLSLGSMAWVMVWHMTGGSWGVPIRRVLEAAIACLPLLIVLWIPIAIGIHANYEWSHPGKHEYSPWLTTAGFVLRGIGYFIIWSIFAWFLLRYSHEQDVPPEKALGPQLRAVSGVGLVVYAWSITFAVIDWVMSLTPGWISTIYGMIFMVGQALIAMCFVVIVMHWLRAYEPIGGLVRPHDFHDYGKLMLTFVMLWAYFNFSQWLIIWAGNIPDETTWFMDRIQGDWGYIAFALIIGQFAVPFSLLLSRPLKRNSGTLIWVAAWLIAMRWLDMYWNVEPSFSRQRLHFSWMDVVIPVALFGLWCAFFFWNLARRPMVALYDPHVPVFLEAKHD